MCKLGLIQEFQEANKPLILHYFVEFQHCDVERKWEDLQCYGDEMRSYPFPRSQEGVLNLAMQRGMQCGKNYAEAFKLVRGFEL